MTWLQQLLYVIAAAPVGAVFLFWAERKRHKRIGAEEPVISLGSSSSHVVADDQGKPFVEQNWPREFVNGIFWVAGQENKTYPGLLRLKGRWPRLEVFGGLTPAFVVKHDPDIGITTRTPAEAGTEELTVHGRIS